MTRWILSIATSLCVAVTLGGCANRPSISTDFSANDLAMSLYVEDLDGRPTASASQTAGFQVVCVIASTSPLPLTWRGGQLSLEQGDVVVIPPPPDPDPDSDPQIIYRPPLSSTPFGTLLFGERLEWRVVALPSDPAVTVGPLLARMVPPSFHSHPGVPEIHLEVSVTD